MNSFKSGLFFFSILLFILSCEKNEVFTETKYDCSFDLQDSVEMHPQAGVYQNILDNNQKNGLVGAVLLVKDKHGLWTGAAGNADIASGIDMQPCNRFLIASISKVFTAAAVFRYVDQGILSLEDPVNKWLPNSITDKVANANEAQIKHLLSHTSGMVDYYTTQLELDRINNVHNEWTMEDVLEYVYGKKADFEVGETYGYCNTNYLLLSMILESASGLSFQSVYEQEVFIPAGLNSAYYSESKPIPDDCVKGYADIYGNGQYAESRFLYEDEVGIGGDGGIAINAHDLSVFLEKLMKGELISQSSLEDMTNWFDMPEFWHWFPFGQTENGYGFEKFNTAYGYAVGHTGGMDGFSTYGFYFPEEDMTYVLFINSVGGYEAETAIFEQTMAVMFED
jgi:D-alanyl-D-alanine carboxypeptidase